MSSIVTAIPSGSIKEWCVQSPSFGWSNPVPNECANATLGTYPSDFETICCDGMIVDTSKDLFRSGSGQTVDLENLVCCRIQGDQQGGIGPPLTGGTECETGTPVPLASLAATNTRNVQNFLVTYTSASFGSHTTANFIPTETPYCLWAFTANGTDLTNVTVAAADITTLSSSSTSYLFGTMSLSNQISTQISTKTGSSTAAGQSSVSTSSASIVTLRSVTALLLLCGAVTLGQSS